MLFYLYTRVLFVYMLISWLRRAIFCVFVSCTRRVLFVYVCVAPVCSVCVFCFVNVCTCFVCLRAAQPMSVLYVCSRVFFLQHACSLDFKVVTRYGRTIWSVNHNIHVFMCIYCVC